MPCLEIISIRSFCELLLGTDHSDEQATVVTEVGWPPFLTICHQIIEILLDCIVIKTLELLRVVLLLAEWIRLRCVLSKDV